MTIISREAWVERYAKHMLECAHMPIAQGRLSAEASLQMGAADDFATPEEAAADELRSWSDDEGGIE